MRQKEAQRRQREKKIEETKKRGKKRLQNGQNEVKKNCFIYEGVRTARNAKWGYGDSRPKKK